MLFQETFCMLMMKICFKNVRLKQTRILYSLFSLFLFLNILFLYLYFTLDKFSKSQYEVDSTSITEKHLNILEHKRYLLSKILNSFKPKQFLKLADRITFPILANITVEYKNACNRYLGNPVKTSYNLDSWQAIDDGNFNETYLYSAYYDFRKTPACVKAFGISNGRSKPGKRLFKYCYLWYNGISKPDVVEANYKFIFETHEKIYVASVHECLVSRTAVPVYVSLSHHKCQQQRHFVKVRDNSEHLTSPSHNFTVCVSPLHSKYNNAVQLIEMVETSRFFGASHFTFYNHSSGSQIIQVLASYEAEGAAEVFKWDIPVQVDSEDPRVEVEIHYFGQLAAMNDCLYRNMFKSRWVVFLDLDEMLVPLMHDNWLNMLRHANAEWDASNSFIQDRHLRSTLPGSYLIQNVFLPSQWKQNMQVPFMNFLPKDDQILLKQLKPRTVASSRCEGTIFPHYVRSKYVVWSRLAEYMEVHQAFSFVQPRLSQLKVPSRTALLYHFRYWPHPSEKNFQCSRLFDFSSTLVPIILAKYKNISMIT